MSFHTKFGLFALAIGAVGLMNATPVFATDDVCVRVPVVGGGSFLYQDYHVSTQTLTKQPYSEASAYPLFIDSFAGDGSVVAVLSAFGDDGSQQTVLRFIDGGSQTARDVPFNGQAEFVQMSYGYRTGWAPDGQHYAIPITDPVTYASSLKIFTGTGDLAAETVYESQYGSAFWSWSPQSDRVEIMQADPSKTSGEYFYRGMSLLTVSGDLIPADLKESLNIDLNPVADWSPDGRLIAVADRANLQIVNSITGEAIPLSNNHYFEVGDGSEMMWTPDSQYLLYLSKEHYDQDATLVLRRYNAQTGKTTELLDFVIPTFRFSPDSAGETQHYMAASVQGESTKTVIVDGITGESHTLGQGQDYYEWSLTGDTLLTRGAAGLVIIPVETEKAFQPPAESANSLIWSHNGEWIGFSAEDGSGGFALWLINAKTGAAQPLGSTTTAADVIPSDEGAAFVREDIRLSLLFPGTDPTIIAENFLMGYDANAPYGNVWSPDGSMGVFAELSVNDLILHLVQSDGTLLADQVVLLGGMPYGTIQWVGCTS